MYISIYTSIHFYFVLVHIFSFRLCLPSCGKGCCTPGVKPTPHESEGLCPPGCPLVSTAILVLFTERTLYGIHWLDKQTTICVWHSFCYIANLACLRYLIFKNLFFLNDYHKRPYYNNNRYQRRIWNPLRHSRKIFLRK